LYTVVLFSCISVLTLPCINSYSCLAHTQSVFLKVQRYLIHCLMPLFTY
jgi:hypothetical protein